MQEIILSGRYRILAELGRGAFGQTYMAEDIQLPGTPKCVVKQLKPIKTDPYTLQTARRLFTSEAQALHNLGNNDQIPRLLAYFEENQEFYLVQELIEGQTLSEEITSGHQWSETKAIAFLQDLLSVLKFIHDRNVIHRDIKPSNLIRRASDGKLVLIDFGGVKQINSPLGNPDGHSNLTVAISTFGYTPQEQLQGRPRLSSDIYAVGMVAIQALTGRHPSKLGRDEQTDEAIWREFARVSEPLAAILDKMVRYQISNRYQSASEVLADLDKIPQLLLQQQQTIAQNQDTVLANFSTQNVPATGKQSPPTKTGKSTVVPNTGSRPSQPTVVAWGLSRFPIKLWQILAALGAIAVIIGGVELVYPIIRPSYYASQGEGLLKADRPEEALEVFRKITNDLKPNDAKAWQGQGEALYDLERYEASLSAYEKALQLQPNDTEALNKKGKVLYDLDRYSEALQAHEMALKIAPNDAQSWYGKGLASIGLKRYEEALAAFDKAREIKLQSPQVWQNKGLALEYLQRREEALKVYEEAIATYDQFLKNNPNNSQGWVDRGSVLSKLRRYDAALESSEKALQINPNFYRAWLLKGNTLFFMRRYDDALKAFDKAVEIRPKSYLAWHNRGSLLAGGLNNFEEAIKSFDKALEIKPSFYDAWRDRGASLEALNKYNEAIDSFDRALKIKPNDYKSWASKGLTLTSQGRYEEAIAAFDKAKSIEPNDAFIWFSLGEPLEKLQRDEEALKAYDKAIEINPAFEPAFQARKQLRQKLGR